MTDPLETQEQNSRLFRTIRNLLIVAMAVLIIAVLKTLSSLLLPLVLAILLTLVSLPLVIRLKEIGLPKGIIIPLVALITITVLVFIINVVTITFSEVLSQQAYMAEQFNLKLNGLYKMLGQYLKQDWDYNISPLTYILDQVDLTDLIKKLAASVGSFSSSFFLFTLYYVFLLIGISDYKTYLHFVADNDLSLLKNFETLQGSVSTYMTIKSIISLVTAVNAYIICKIFGVNFALFWGFLTFILNFIPNIGSIISSLAIMFIAFIQFDGYTRFLVVSLLVSLNQMVIGNFIDPLVMGSRLRLNTVTVIFGLVFWGYIWEVPGMLLSVPLMVIIKLVLEQSESLGILARVMGSPEKPEKISRRFRRNNRKKEDSDDVQ